MAVLAVMAACGSDPTQTDTSGGDSSGGASCILGYDNCGCYVGTCLGTLVCEQDICVSPAISDAESTVGAEDESSSGAIDPTLESTSPGDSSSSSGVVETSSESSSESSTTAAIPDCVDDELACADGELQTCVAERWQATSCTDQCALTGHTSSGCADETSCACDGYLDMGCADGTNAFCYCLEYFDAGSCTADDLESYYLMCFEMTEPTIACFGGYIAGNYVDCDAAANACL